ncbi:MAG: imidazolonepropionase, partial [Mesorhizobium sp.]
MGGASGKSGHRVWRNARLVTMADGAAGLGIVEKGAVAARDGLIVYA